MYVTKESATVVKDTFDCNGLAKREARYDLGEGRAPSALSQREPLPGDVEKGDATISASKLDFVVSGNEITIDVSSQSPQASILSASARHLLTRPYRG